MTPTVEQIEARPKRCPDCGSDDVLSIVYGLVSDPAFAGEAVAFGGCCVHPGESPMWQCRDCGHEWGRLLADGLRLTE